MKIDILVIKILKNLGKKLFRIFKKAKERKARYMKKQRAIRYLKLLHNLEKQYGQNLFTTDLQKLAQRLRLEFIEAYNDKKGI